MQTHQSLFVSYIVAGVTTSWQQIHASEVPIAEPVRQQAWHILSFALGIPAAWSVTRTLLLTLAPKMEQAGFRDDWIPYLEKGFTCAQAAGDEQAAAECELQIGLLYRLQSRFEEAKQWTKASVEHFAVQGDTQAQARALNELAWLEHLQHRYEDATCHIEEALAKLEDDDPERAMCYRVQGMIAVEQGEFQAAEVYHRKALVAFTEQQDHRRMAWSLQNIAYMLRKQKDFEKAIPLYQEAEKILKAVNDIYHWAFVNLNLGATYYHAGKAKIAITPYSDALKVFSQMQNKLYLAHTQNNLGLCYLALYQFEQSEMAFGAAIKLFTEIAEHGWLVNAMDGLAMTYLASKQFDKAIFILNQARAALPEIIDTPNYAHLHYSLNEHWQEAHQNQKLP